MRFRFRRRGQPHVVDVPPVLVPGIERLAREFEAKFGRPPGPDDPVFFDPNADTPKPMNVQDATRDIAAAMVAANIAPEMIYAFQKTGLIVCEENLHLLSPADINEWNSAIAEYEAKHGRTQ